MGLTFRVFSGKKLQDSSDLCYTVAMKMQVTQVSRTEFGPFDSHYYYHEGETMAKYKIHEIEGIGDMLGKKLEEIGVKSVDILLEKGATKAGRTKLAKETGIDVSKILKWVNMADLFRVKGIGKEYAELLEKAGVDTVKELRTRNAENLQKKMEEVNAAGGKRLVRQVPYLKTVQSWIEEAAKLEPIVKY